MRPIKLKWPQRSWWRGRLALVLALLLTLLFSGTALAAEVLSGDPYILPRGEVVHDDLYVTGSEVIIDGTVEGDLIVAAGYIEVNGVVMGDLLAAGGGVMIAGAIQDDVRAAGAGVVLAGSVGDDYFAAGGGGFPGMVTLPMRQIEIEGHSVPLGVQVNGGSTIGGDAYLAGGTGAMAGEVGGDLLAGMANFALSGRVAGDADLEAQSLSVADSAVVQGELRYGSGSDTTIPEGVAASVVEQPRDQAAVAAVAPVRRPVRGFLMWLLRTALLLAGYLIVGWLLWTFAPRQITGPTAVLETRPMEAGIIGLLAVVAVLPVGAALTALGILFWNFFPGGLVMVTFVVGLVALLWLFSPIPIGLWVGEKIGRLTGAVEGELPRLLLGIAAIVLVARVLTVIPCVGDLVFQVIYLAALALSVGSWFLARRLPPQEPALLPAPAAT